MNEDISARVGPVGGLTGGQVRLALAAAMAAPSPHNSQPWRFRCSPTAIELYADTSRALPAADPEHRELLLACGAALLNLRVTIRSFGIHLTVSLFPERLKPDLLAILRCHGRVAPSTSDRMLADAIIRRRTNRRPFSSTAIAASVLNGLQRAARIEQAWLAPITSAQLPTLRALVHSAHDTRQADPCFVAERTQWTGGDDDALDGVPARSSGPLPEAQDEWVLRDFSVGTAAPRVPGKDFEPTPLIAVIGSFHDLPLDHLQAGQATQRVLLTAAANGLAVSFLSQVIKVPAIRTHVRDLIGGGLWPHTVLRLGYGSSMPATPRRPVEDVLSDGQPSF